MAARRFLPFDEKVVHESGATYLGGHSRWSSKLDGSLVLTNKRLYFEVIIGGLFDKRPELFFEVLLTQISEVKVGKYSSLSKPVLTVVYKSSSGNLEQPSFQVEDPENWKSAFSSVKIGSPF
ncbi:MAG: hypothetical protein QXS21_04275 [Thermoproteota archaeon]|nr:hypothetical protein [Candidatus Brockarchaeota archaeon]MBO3802123.1 hypothetical protein [Candidatus Brockarchaeota archaeon]